MYLKSSLVTYQLRTSYLNDIADGVGERLLTLNDSFLNTAAFKAAGWRSNPAHIKRTHSPPIPTAVASEYFQAPRSAGLTLEDEHDEGGALGGGGGGLGSDTVGPSMAAASKRRRRREQMGEEDEDSSDLSDESDDEPEQRAAQQIKFAKMPLRNRSGSSPIQSSNLRQVSTVSSTTSSPQRPAPRRGSQSALETVKERARRDTVTSSEVSSENEFDSSGYQRQREQARAQARAARMQSRLNSDASLTGVKRQESDLLEEEEEDDSDASDISSAYVGSIDSASILNGADNPLNASPRQQIVGTPPREFTRTSTIRKSHAPPPHLMPVLPPPRPVSMVRPLSMIQPKSLLSEALKAKKTKPAIPFDGFASLSGQGDPNPIMVRIYAIGSKNASKPYEVAIRRTVHEGQAADRAVTVADLIGLSLWRYNEEKREPPLPADKLNVNWWTLRMVEEGGEVDDDFPPLERKKQLISFTTANNRAGRMRSNSKVYDEFALVQASPDEFAENQKLTPQFTEEALTEEPKEEDELTPRNTPQPNVSVLTPSSRPRQNPIITTTYRHNSNLLADMPPAPVTVANTTRGKKKLLRIHIHSIDAAPGQMVTLDVTTDTYLEEVLDLVCKKRQLDKAAHVLKLPGSGAVVLIDREVSSIGNVSDLELHRRRFATDGPSTMTGGSPSSASPKVYSYPDSGSGSAPPAALRSKGRLRTTTAAMLGAHPLATEALKQDELVNSNYKKYTVWRKQPMRFANLNERLLTIDGEYIHIVPSSGGRAMLEGGGKTTTVHFSNVVGCKVSRRHPTHFKLLVFKATESKRYDFEAKSASEAAEIVQELKKGISPYRDV
ncbi:uncharacterized protein E0L32_005568 [Thyridium curvatum]|uniref:Uncharacterized protein n=1 Tax=Thyridium curvatum TaxID=1093900 RepID=A0A507AWM7_9PEZI|nr:uncharacterized protein E0L32_005568 [Thyridium curvatum]TPX14372.1 hypothetical protein E0L32_005568 [Thyridium curvatum]